jgi:hypothetical protein
VVALASVGIALLQRPPANQYLSPDSTGANGTHALTDVLTELGHQVVVGTSASAAAAADRAGSTLVVTSPQYLSATELAVLARSRADVLLVEPDSAALRQFAPGVTLAPGSAGPVRITRPDCTLAAARLAGTADLGGLAFRVHSPAAAGQQCYVTASGPALVQVRAGARLVTVLGTGAPLTNALLGSEGNAALAINLLAGHRIVWLVPPVAAVAATAAGQPKSFTELVPLTAYLVVAQLAVALLVTMIWRARRLGPLIAEPLPVVVRASETIEGHGRLYQSRHARAQAADGLRTAARARIAAAAGLPAGAAPGAVSAAAAGRTAHPQARITELLYGPQPDSDRALVMLARDLDELEREAGTT